MSQCLHSNLFFRERKKKRTLLSDDKHFPWLFKNDINVAGEDDAVVIASIAKGLAKFQGTQDLRNISLTFT